MEPIPRVYSAQVTEAGEWEPLGEIKGLFLRIQGDDFFLFCSSSQRFFTGVVETGPLCTRAQIEGALWGTDKELKVHFCLPTAWRVQIATHIWATPMPCQLRELEKMDGLRRVLGFSYQVYSDGKKKQGELEERKQNALTESEELRDVIEKEQKDCEERKRKVADNLVELLNESKRRKLAGWNVSIEEALAELKQMSRGPVT